MRYKVLLALLVLGLAFAVTLSLGSATVPNNPAQGKGFSIVSMEPDAAQALKAQGKTWHYPFPNSANQGRKFNPTGGTIPALVTSPIQEVLVLFVNFTTPPPGGPTDRMDLAYSDDLLFGTVYDPPEYAGIPNHPIDRTLYNFYQEASYGKVSVVTSNMPSTMGWTNAGHPYDYYAKADGIHDNGFGPYPQNAQGLVIDAIKAADSQVDFSQYAVNGEVPNLFVVFAGTGAEWSGTGELIWSHSWDLTEGTGLNGYMADGVKINNYAVMPEVGGDLTGFTGVVSGPYPPTVGVYAHEYGHVLGVPDQYDYGYESQGTGNLSLMSGGSWNRYPLNRIFDGNSPAQLDAWSKYRLGFVTPKLITTAKNVSLPNVETNPVVYKMIVPNSGGKEYFLFENRQNVGFDQGLLFRHYDSTGKIVGDPIHGLAVYHVDETVFTRNYWRADEAENWKEFRSEGWQKAPNGETHYGISLIQADDRWDLEHGTNAGDTGDLYPGTFGVMSLSSYTHPNTSSYYFWGGSAPKYGYSGVTVKNIAENAGIVTANFSFVPWTPAGK